MERRVVMGRAQSITWVKILALLLGLTHFSHDLLGSIICLVKIIMLLFIDDLL